jgi:hypothetical protein
VYDEKRGGFFRKGLLHGKKLARYPRRLGWSLGGMALKGIRRYGKLRLVIGIVYISFFEFCSRRYCYRSEPEFTQNDGYNVLQDDGGDCCEKELCRR